MNFNVIIPARYSSERLPGKPLKDLNGKPVIRRVYDQAVKSSAKRVIIATDDERIASIANQFGAEVCLTHAHHLSGTDRLQEVVENLCFAEEEIIVNVQGDEPFIPPANIDQLAAELASAKREIAMTTLYTPITRVEEIFSPDVVKVVTDKTGNALYFSRAPLPWDRKSFSQTEKKLPAHSPYKRHIGIYAYRAEQLNAFVRWEKSPLEMAEQLEQLRFLWNGHKIRAIQAQQIPPAGIDTKEDLEQARRKLTQSKKLTV